MDLSAYLDGYDRRDWQTVETGTLRLAMVGLGWWTRERAIPAVASSDRCETTVVVSGHREKAMAVVEGRRTIERGLTYDEFHDGAAADAYDAVYVATPNALHLPFVETAAELGKPVLCEKPMEATVERAATMVETAADGDIPLMVGYRMQTDPAIRRARELVRDGFVGEPAHLHGHMTQPLLEMNPDPDQWRLDPDLAGPGTSVTDLGIYPINTARFVLEADPTSVSAAMHSSADGFERVPDERASFEVAFDGGALAAFTASQNADRSGRFEIVGTAGRLTLEPAFFGDDRRSMHAERGGTAAEFVFEPVDQMVEEFAYFADRVLGEAPLEPDGEHGLADVRAIEAVYESASLGQRVEL